MRTVHRVSAPRVDEDLRQGEHLGVVFKDGPSGRRAALAAGPDVWEVVRALREVDERGEAAVDAEAELLSLTPARVRIALRYHAAHEREFDAEIAEAEAASVAAERAWQAEQRPLR